MKTPEPTPRRVACFLIKFTLELCQPFPTEGECDDTWEVSEGIWTGHFLTARLCWLSAHHGPFRSDGAGFDATTSTGRSPDRVGPERAEISSSSIGIVQVTGMTSATVREFFEVAVQKGEDLGCETLLPHAVYELHSGSATPKQPSDFLIFGAQASAKLPSGVARWQFICAVQDSSRDPIATGKVAIDAAFAIEKRESGRAMCRWEARTGSHMLEQVCRFE